MAAKYEVIKKGFHFFQVGEIVTKASENEEAFQTGLRLARAAGIETEYRKQTAVYQNNQGLVQLLENDEVKLRLSSV